MEWILANWVNVVETLLAIFGAIGLIVKMTPSLKDDNIILPIIKFLGKLTNKQL
jgi:hypothetical protein